VFFKHERTEAAYASEPVEKLERAVRELHEQVAELRRDLDSLRRAGST
jgi:phage shock protein A